MEQIKRIQVASYYAMVLSLLVVSPVFAEGHAPKIVTGAVKLAQDAFGWILILVPVTAGTMFAWHAWMKSMADGDPGTIAEKNKKMKGVLVYSAIAEGASGLVFMVLSYFQ